MKKIFMLKLNSKSGETLPEALIAILIVAMGMVMLGTLLNVSSRMVEKGQAKVEAVYSEISEMDGGQAGEANVTADNAAKVKIKYSPSQDSQTTINEVSVILYEGSNLISYEPKTAGGTP